ncbi:MAG TPA: hypothetical protein VN922_19540 [Bacteroidia bacterium]|nr:hypothetical protein [Bacteroidia bacterium]
MAEVSKKEFSQQCGFATNQLSVFISRKKVIVKENGLIDTEEPANVAFLLKQKARDKSDKNVTNSKDVERQQEISKTQSSTPIDLNRSPKKPKRKTSDSEFFELETQQKELAIQKATEEIELLRIRREKLNGELIPTDLVKIIFSQHTKSILVEFNNSIDKVLTVFKQSAQLSKADEIRIRKQLLDELNLSSKKSLDESKKNIYAIINQFSEKRTKGEHS